MNPQVVRDKAKKARPCALCTRRTRLRVYYEHGIRRMATRSLCAVCLQALGMMAQAQKMLGEEDDTLKPAPPPTWEVPSPPDDEGYTLADEIDEVTAAGYAMKEIPS